MARKPRVAPGGSVYHVLNRSAGRIRMFRTSDDFLAFERLIAEAVERHPMRIISYCILSNHWHFVVWPRRDGDLTAFFRWLTHTHAMRFRVAHRTVGYGHLYQGRFKSFPIQPTGESLRTVCRYVERNALTAGLVKRAEDWRFGSLWVRQRGGDAQRAVLSDGPEPIPAGWVQRVNQPLTGKELARMKVSMERGRPLGDDAWVRRTASRLGLEHTLRREGRPTKTMEKT